LFSYAIYDENITAKNRLFATATPKISNYDDDEISMTNTILYGECIDTYQIGEAIDDNYLCPYELHCMYISNNDILNFINKNYYLDDVIYNFHYISCMMIIKQKLLNNHFNHLLTYHSSINSSIQFTEMLNKHVKLTSKNKISEHLRNKIKFTEKNIDEFNQYINNFDIFNNDDLFVAHLDGTCRAKKRKSVIDTFSNNKKGIITSSRVLNEGVNIPIVDSICFVEPRTSSIDIIQCVEEH
jgi:predicted helicase